MDFTLEELLTILSALTSKHVLDTMRFKQGEIDKDECDGRHDEIDKLQAKIVRIISDGGYINE